MINSNMAKGIPDRQTVIEAMFKQYDTDGTGELTPPQLQALHASLRQGGISLPQVHAAMKYSCLCDDTCEPTELFDVLQEMDRRYFLVQDFRWEFAMLDRQQTDFISEEQARFLFEVVHGDLFSKRRWDKFLRSRAVPGSGLSFVEIEVDLCNIPSRVELAMEQLEEQKEREEKTLKIMEKKLSLLQAKQEKDAKEEDECNAKEQAERRKMEESNKRKDEEEERLRREREEEERHRKEEEQGRLEAEEREHERKKNELEREHQRELEIIEVQQALEAQRELERAAKELEEQERKEKEQARNVEHEAEVAKVREKAAEEEAKIAREALQQATGAAAKRAAEEADKAAREKAKRERNERIRKDLKVAIKKKDRDLLTKAVCEFKAAMLADTEGDLAKAEHLLKRFKAKENLIVAMEKRKLEDLEKAIDFVKKNGFEAAMPEEMVQANKMLLALKRLKRLKDEILNLKQSTVAEIRSYSKPPKAVHKVMIGTYLLLGNKEKTLQVICCDACS